LSEKSFGYDYLAPLLVRLYRSTAIPTGIDPNGTQTIINAAKQEIFTIPYVEYCPGQQSEMQANLVKAALQSASANIGNQAFYLSRAITVKVIPTKVAGCLCDLANPTEACLSLGRNISALKARGYYPDIFTSKKDWTRIFQGVACNNFANTYRVGLTYASYLSNGKLD
jgi:hypothetical protein